MSRRLKSAQSEFETLADRSTTEFERQFVSLLRAIASGDASGLVNARERVAVVFAETLTLADMMGRRRVFLEFDAAAVQFDHAGGELFRRFLETPGRFLGTEAEAGMLREQIDDLLSFAASPIVPHVPFAEALSDMITREPRLAATAGEVAELYRNRHAFALARSADMSITRAVQSFVTRSIAEGVPTVRAAEIVAGMGDFTRSYAHMAYRTNLNTAYTAGRMEQARQPEIRVALPAFERWSIRDSAVRRGRESDGPKGGLKENHVAAHGFVADTADPRWRLYASPSGYGCRCGIRLVPVGELKRRGLFEKGRVVPFEPATLSQFRPHPNFGKRRPDFEIYGG